MDSCDMPVIAKLHVVLPGTFAISFRDGLGSHGHLEREHIEGGNSGSRRVL